MELDQGSVTQTSPGAMPTDLRFPTQLRRQGQVCAHFSVQFPQSSGMSMALSYHDLPFEGQTSILHLALSSWALVSLFYHPDCKQERSPFSHVCPPLLTLRLITEQSCPLWPWLLSTPSIPQMSLSFLPGHLSASAPPVKTVPSDSCFQMIPVPES